VYLAHDTREHRDVAIKLVPEDEGDGMRAERFRQEALVLSRLRSPNVAHVRDFGRDPAVGLYLVMDLVSGVPLEAAALGRPLLPHEVLIAARALLAGLAEVHAAGLAHRDVKPANVLVPGGVEGLAQLQLIDFGIARSERRAALLEAMGSPDTRAGIVVGTPAYMAPEQLLEHLPGSPGSDVYAAGLVLFELLGAGPLFEGGLRHQLLARSRESPRLEGRVDGPLRDLLERMLARDPEHRFRSAREALRAISELATASVDMGSLGLPPSGLSSSLAPPRPSGPAPPAGARRMQALPPLPADAFEAALSALELPMLDALARREKEGPFGTLARAAALALRLELDEAARVLEPLAESEPLAAAVLACLVAPRARRELRMRLVAAPEGWLQAIPPAFAARLLALATGLAPLDDPARTIRRADVVASRAAPGSAAHVTARLVARASRDLASAERAPSQVTALLALGDEASPSTALGDYGRALVVGVAAFRVDEAVARRALEDAARIAQEAAAPLLESRALISLGGMLVEHDATRARGLGLLERATTLLVASDSPALEAMALHNRGVPLFAAGRYEEAVGVFERARRASAEERLVEPATLAACIELWSRCCAASLGEGATAPAAALGDAAMEGASSRTAALARVARSLLALRREGLESAQRELSAALDLAHHAETGDAAIFVEALSLALAAARGEPVDVLARAGDIARTSEERGFAEPYGLRALRDVAEHVGDASVGPAMREALDRIVLLLVPARRPPAAP
jgi:serine/threonine-protein kinase